MCKVTHFVFYTSPHEPNVLMIKDLNNLVIVLVPCVTTGNFTMEAEWTPPPSPFLLRGTGCVDVQTCTGCGSPVKAKKKKTVSPLSCLASDHGSKRVIYFIFLTRANFPTVPAPTYFYPCILTRAGSIMCWGCLLSADVCVHPIVSSNLTGLGGGYQYRAHHWTQTQAWSKHSICLMTGRHTMPSSLSLPLFF